MYIFWNAFTPCVLRELDRMIRTLSSDDIYNSAQASPRWSEHQAASGGGRGTQAIAIDHLYNFLSRSASSQLLL